MAIDAHTTDAPRAPVRRPRRLSARAQRQSLELALERLLDAVEGAVSVLDDIDGDSDFEPLLGGSDDDREAECEDEGAQCDDEGFIEYETVCQYADDGLGGENQLVIRGSFRGVCVSERGC